MVNGLPVFWPHPVASVQRLVAVVDRDGVLRKRVEREAELARQSLAKTGKLPEGVLAESDGTLLLANGARITPTGDIMLAVQPNAAVPLLAKDANVTPADLNLTAPLVASENDIPTPPVGEKVSRVADDGRVFTTLLGEYVEQEVNHETGVASWKFKTGNREYGPAFRWIAVNTIGEIDYPLDALVLEREENLTFYGYLDRLQTEKSEPAEGSSPVARLNTATAAAKEAYRARVKPLKSEEERVADELRRNVKYDILRAQYEIGLEQGEPASQETAALEAHLASLQDREKTLLAESEALTRRRVAEENGVRKNIGVFSTAAGRETPIALVDIVRAYSPNRMGFGQKLAHYAAKVWELLSADPREANQDGGLFPAIFGTVLLVFLMAITCFPLGVLAGIYLGEYAKDGPLVRLVRVAVNNLAGIPSIVYGIFGLGFFVYACGGALDTWFYPERVQAGEPVFGQGCIFWASLTLGLLTIPVVIVATEEALRTIPRGIKEGSYALGATKFQTLCRVLAPMASPGMMTGFILAMARAAGEVAPLMLTGAVKLAPAPVQGDFPFIRLNGQFMHLGFHVLDISCKSPNVEATKPMVYVTTLLLLVLVLTMSGTAVVMRNRMRKRYASRAI